MEQTTVNTSCFAMRPQSARRGFAAAGSPLCRAMASVVAITGLWGHLPSTRAAETSAPLLDYLKMSSYAGLLAIEPAGYFEVGRRYVHPPRVEFKPVPGAARYELILLQGRAILGTTRAEATTQPAMVRHFARAGWDRVKPGKAAIVIVGLDSQGKRIALSRMFPFYVATDFEPTVSARPRRSYRDAAMKAFEALERFRLPAATPPPKDGPGAKILPVLLSCAGTDRGYAPYSFPVLHDWNHVEMLESLDKIADAPLKKRIREYARSVGDHLLMCRYRSAGAAYDGLVRGCADYRGGPALGMAVADAAERAKMLRLVEPAKCGIAAETLLRVSLLTGDSKYLAAAQSMAETFHRTQQADGSWPARVDAQTGEVLGVYSSSVGLVASFLERLHSLRPDPRWESSCRRAIAWMVQYPMQTYGWVVNFDDNPAPATAVNPFVGLSNYDLFPFVRYVARHPDHIENAAARIREQMDWVDNHFVFYGADPLLPFEPYYPCCAEQGDPASFSNPMGCWVPMDFHTANWALTLLRLHEWTGQSRWLQRAQGAANTMTQYQLDNGGTMTWMCDQTFGLSSQFSGSPATHNFWPAAWAASAAVWAELAARELPRRP